MLWGLGLFYAAALYAVGSASADAPQAPFQAPDQPAASPDNSTAPFIFNGLSGLLTQWPNTVHGTGHSIVPGVLHPYTLLYHARQDAALPPSPEWLAWDPEMSYAIMVSRGGQTHLLTYRTTRPAKILYFDGMSAAWGDGWLDSQHVFIYGMSADAQKNISWWDDYGRAERLCEWAQTRDVDGFVRMNAGFEIIWCDFESPKLQLVSHLNITPPGTPERSSEPPRSPRSRNLFPTNLDPFEAESQPQVADDPEPRPPRRGGGPPGRGGGGGFPGRPRISALAQTGNLEWVRAASHRSFSPQPHLTLFPAGMVSYYHPRLTSLVPDRDGRAMHAHRLMEISKEDAVSVVGEVGEVLSRGPDGRGSGMDWGTTAVGIVEYWGARISHMHALLLNASDPNTPTSNSLPAIRTLAYTLLNPYMQPGITPTASGWDLFFGVPVVSESQVAFALNANISALSRCTYQATDFLSQAEVWTTPQENLLQTSIETVLGRLCNDFGLIFAQSSDLVESTQVQDDRATIHDWTQRVETLMQWLDWTVWWRCEDVCPRDYVCSTPVWPIAWFRNGWPGGGDSRDDIEALKPRCMRMAVSMQ